MRCDTLCAICYNKIARNHTWLCHFLSLQLIVCVDAQKSRSEIRFLSVCQTISKERRCSLRATFVGEIIFSYFLLCQLFQWMCVFFDISAGTCCKIGSILFLMSSWKYEALLYNMRAFVPSLLWQASIWWK